MKNTKKKRYTIYVIIAGLLPALLTYCAPAYVPNTFNVPDIKNKGEIKLTGMLSTSGLGLNTNMLLSEHLGIMVNGSFARKIKLYHIHIATSLEKGGLVIIPL